MITLASHAARRGQAISARDAFALLPYTTGLAATVAIGLMAVKVVRTPTISYFAPIVAGAVTVFVASLGLAYRFGRNSRARPHWMDQRGVVAWILAIQGGVLLLILPLLALTVSIRADDIGNWTFGFLNKRWLITLYNVTIVTLVVLPLAAARLVASGPERPVVAVAPKRRRRWFRTAIEVSALVLVAWYCAGPPWHLERHHRPIDWHEHAHLGSLQAIAKGYLPYVGPASTQYGPGSQWLMYRIMRASGPFDIVSFRAAWAMFNFAALLVVALVAYLWLGVWLAFAVLLLELAYSPFASFFVANDGTLGGFYGWANALRYLAPLLVIPALTRLDTTSRRVPALPCLALGIVSGVGAWLAQESLSTAVGAGGLLLAVLILTRTLRPSAAVQIVTWLTVGFFAVVGPLLIFYARHGAAGDVIRNYFLMPRAVAAGYSNLWWPAVDRSRLDLYSYYGTLPFLLAITLATLWHWRSARPAMPLDARRSRLLAFTLVLVAAYQTALFRSDYSHLMNTLIALPFVLVLGAVDLPWMLARRAPARWMIRIAFVALACVVYPMLPSYNWAGLVTTPLGRFRFSSPALPAEAADPRIAFQRATGALAHEPVFAGGSGLSMEQFLEFAEDVHRVVGTRKTYVGDLGWRAWPGALYFLADLVPAPYPLDRLTLTFNDELRAMVADHIRAHPQDYDCFVGLSLTDVEAQAFIDTHPHARTIIHVLPAGEGWSPTPVYILLGSAS